MPTTKRQSRKPAKDQPQSDAEFEARLAALKKASTLQLLFRAARLLDEEALRRIAARGDRPRLRRSHTALLPHLDLKGTRISVLAERLGVSKQAVSELIDDLEAAGVVTRKPDPDDARARLVQFTPRGLEGLLEGLSMLRDFEAELARVIGEGAMRALNDALVRILEHLEPEP